LYQKTIDKENKLHINLFTAFSNILLTIKSSRVNLQFFLDPTAGITRSVFPQTV